jgi:hypothetical protein
MTSRTLLAVILFGAIGIGRVEAQPLSDPLGEAIRAANAACGAAHFPLDVQTADCLNDGGRLAWLRFLPAGLPYYDELATERARIAAGVDAKQITLDQAKAQMAAAREAFLPHVKVMWQREQADAYAKEMAEDRRRLRRERWAAAARALARSSASSDDAPLDPGRAFRDSAQAMQPVPLPTPQPPSSFDPGYVRPPPEHGCIGQVPVSGPGFDPCP